MTAKKAPAESETDAPSGGSIFDEAPSVEMGEPEIDTDAALSAPDLSPGPTPRKRGPRKPKAEKVDTTGLTPREKAIHDFADFPIEQLPFDARAGQIEGSVRMHNGLPIAVINLQGWVGEAPLTVLAAELKDVLEVASSLQKQVEKALK